MSKFATIKNGRSIISASSFFRRIKTTKPYLLSVYRDFRSPIYLPSTPSYSFETAGIGDLLFLIAAILRVVSLSEILSAVVQTVSIFVVRTFIVVESENSGMHKQMSAIEVSCSVKGTRGFVPNSEPVPLIETVVIDDINDGVLSLRKRDQTIGLVKRLSHRMSLHASFHLASLKGQLDSAAILT